MTSYFTVRGIRYSATSRLMDYEVPEVRVEFYRTQPTTELVAVLSEHASHEQIVQWFVEDLEEAELARQLEIDQRVADGWWPKDGFGG
jgi:hypothetical protein